MEKQMLTTAEAAELLSLAPSTLRTARHKGKLLGLEPPPFVKMGKAVRYRRADLEAWVEANAETVKP